MQNDDVSREVEELSALQKRLSSRRFVVQESLLKTHDKLKKTLDILSFSSQTAEEEAEIEQTTSTVFLTKDPAIFTIRQKEIDRDLEYTLSLLEEQGEKQRIELSHGIEKLSKTTDSWPSYLSSGSPLFSDIVLSFFWPDPSAVSTDTVSSARSRRRSLAESSTSVFPLLHELPIVVTIHKNLSVCIQTASFSVLRTYNFREDCSYKLFSGIGKAKKSKEVSIFSSPNVYISSHCVQKQHDRVRIFLGTSNGFLLILNVSGDIRSGQERVNISVCAKLYSQSVDMIDYMNTSRGGVITTVTKDGKVGIWSIAPAPAFELTPCFVCIVNTNSNQDSSRSDTSGRFIDVILETPHALILSHSIDGIYTVSIPQSLRTIKFPSPHSVLSGALFEGCLLALQQWQRASMRKASITSIPSPFHSIWSNPMTQATPPVGGLFSAIKSVAGGISHALVSTGLVGCSVGVVVHRKKGEKTEGDPQEKEEKTLSLSEHISRSSLTKVLFVATTSGTIHSLSLTDNTTTTVVTLPSITDISS
ncbi:hypothetical protein ADUPG1_013459, partial [Aduncisulcus paluster]